MSLSLANIIRVTLLGALKGLANINTSVLALITDEVPVIGATSYGTYGIYYDPVSVAQDFGSNSVTYRLATKIFSQSPNIMTGKGYLIIIPKLQTAPAQAAVMTNNGTVDFTKLTQTNYNLKVAKDAGVAADILIGTIDSTSMATLTTSLNSTAITAAGLQFVVSGETTAARVTLQSIATGATKDITISSTITGTDLSAFIKLPIGLKVTGVAAGVERTKDAILRTYAGLSYFGIISTIKETDLNLPEIAQLVQSTDRMFFQGTSLSGDLTVICTSIKNSGYTNTRMLYYGISAATALDFAAAYASRALSVNFDGSNTAQTMHLKDIVGLVGDTTLTQTLLDSAKTNGVDTYADFGVPKTFTSGANGYFDFIYSNLAFKLRLITAGFNYLATTNTKIPQTEEGMNGLKSAYRDVCISFVTNGTFAPGTWLGSTKFGDPADHVRNIKDYGFFIYSQPIAAQSLVERTARVAPLVQIACKSSGAIHSSDVTVFVEA